MPSKDPEEELREEARKRKIKRPSRTYCEACRTDFGTPLALLAHIRKVH
jgi:hypothetical protein